LNELCGRKTQLQSYIEYYYSSLNRQFCWHGARRHQIAFEIQRLSINTRGNSTVARGQSRLLQFLIALVTNKKTQGSRPLGMGNADVNKWSDQNQSGDVFTYIQFISIWQP